MVKHRFPRLLIILGLVAVLVTAIMAGSGVASAASSSDAAATGPGIIIQPLNVFWD